MGYLEEPETCGKEEITSALKRLPCAAKAEAVFSDFERKTEMKGLEIGISTSCYYPLETEKALIHLVESGADCGEIFINSDSELSSEYLKEFRRVLKDKAIRIRSVHPFTSGMESLLFFSEYERRFWDGVEYYKKFFQAAAELGASYLVFHGEKADTKTSEDLYFERYSCLNEEAKRFGILLAHENVSRCRGRDPEFLERLKDAMGDDAAFVLDFKQARRAGVDYHELFQRLGTTIRHLHISDWDENCDCLPIGKGRMDLSILIRELQTLGYQGGMILELYRQNYGGYEELLTSLFYMKKIAAEF